jgi:uncharacterized membrane protein
VNDQGMTKAERDLSRTIGLVLRYGVVTSFVIVALGSALLLLEGQTGYSSLGSHADLYGAPVDSQVGLLSLIQGVASAKPYAIIDLGLFVLLATPVARVAISILLFEEERRYVFVAITSIVLGILLLSIFVVAPLVSG